MAHLRGSILTEVAMTITEVFKMSIEVIIITIEVEVLQIIDSNKVINHIETDPMIISTGIVLYYKTGMKTVTIIMMVIVHH